MSSLDRKTKIIATLGPGTFDPAMIKKLIQTGVNIFRLNFSHSDYKLAEKAISDIRSISEKLKKETGILIDLQGPKIRIGRFTEGSIQLKKGDPFTITIEDIPGNQQIVSTTYKNIINDAKKGNIILLDDGKLKLKVENKDEKNVYTKVVVGGPLSDRKGMNLPKMKTSVAAVTEKDKEDILFGIKHHIDYLALSFVRTSKDIEEIKTFLKDNNAEIPVIAKIEKPEALRDIKEIIRLADGVMVARGDLGIELSLEKVPTVQKELIRAVNYAAKPVIVATQMLESMISSPCPTRAEVSDVANAIYDWADVIMLSGETAVGKFPIQAVETMANVAEVVDEDQSEHKRSLTIRKTQFIEEASVVSSLCDSADELADEIGAKAIITFTDSGRTALLLSKYRTSVPIIAITDNKQVSQRMTMYRGVWPVVATRPFKQLPGLRDMLKEAQDQALDLKLVKKGDMVVIIAGIPIGIKGSTNMIRVHRLGDPF
jgi:pyruvate kinase